MTSSMLLHQSLVERTRVSRDSRQSYWDARADRQAARIAELEEKVELLMEALYKLYKEHCLERATVRACEDCVRAQALLIQFGYSGSKGK